MKKQFLKVNTVIGVPQLESDKDGAFLNEAQIELLDNKIDTLEKAVETEKANVVNEKALVTAAETRANTAEGTVAKQATKITELETQIANMKKGPGAGDTTVIKETDEGGEGNEKGDSFVNTVASARKLYDLLPD